MNPPVIKYPFDLTGRSTNNLVLAEPHDIGTSGNRIIVLNHGPFYTKGLVVRDRGGRILTKKTEYVAAQIMPDLIDQTGQEVCGLVVITDPAVQGPVTVDYQVVGGPYSTSVPALLAMIAALQIDNRSILWGAIVGKPERFQPAPHLHDIGDLYGFEYIVAALERLTQAIFTGDQQSHNEIYQYIDSAIKAFGDGVNPQIQEMLQHLQDRSNPHGVTKSQVQLGNVDNFPTATEQQAVDGASNAVFMTALRTRQAISSQVATQMSTHLNDRTNPHGVTKEQVQLGLVVNRGLATSAEARNGSSGNYMTAALTKEAIDSQAMVPLNSHINRTDNPHGVTKAQVQLGSVRNLPTATQQQALDGTSDDVYMTALRVRQAINSLAGGTIEGHVNRTDNPHQVTKAQVQLGSVQNYPIADNGLAAQGTSTVHYMTPQLTAHAINTIGANLVNGHANRRDNPHGVNSAQVGLGNVHNLAQVVNNGANMLYLRWDGSQIIATVDVTNMGRVHTTAQPDPSISLKFNTSGGTLTGHIHGPSATFTGELRGGTIRRVSDERLKTFDGKLGDDVLDKLMQVETYVGRYRVDILNGLPGHAHMMVSAQQLQTVFADMVQKGSDGILSVDYNDLTVANTRAIQTLKGKHDALAKKFAALEKKFKKLEKLEKLADKFDKLEALAERLEKLSANQE